MRQTRIRILAECAMMLALSIALSYVKLYELPWGGSVTLFSMLPVMLVSIRHGLKWGFATSFLFSLFQLISGNPFSFGLTPAMLVGSIFLDYVVAFTVLGFAGIFRKGGIKGCFIGVVLACLLRFASHFAAGVFLWAKYDEFVVFGSSFFNRPALYSFLYNGAYMGLETLLIIAGTCALFFIPQAKKLIFKDTDIPVKG